MMPNFLIIGAPRCGTTFMYHGLKDHPEIFMSPDKEPLFFDHMDGEDQIVFPGIEHKIKDFSSYKDLFSDVTNEKAIGEASTLYLYSPRAYKNIYRTIPNVRLIGLLRNPVDRAYSHYLEHVMRGEETANNFYEAFMQGEERMRAGWSPFLLYKAMGLYSHQIERYQSIFNPEQLLILLYEDFKNNPADVFKQVFRFLDVTDDVVVDPSVQHSPSGIPKARFLHNFLSTPNLIKDLIKKFLPERLHYRFHLYLLRLNLDRPILDDELRSHLLEHFEVDILRTQELIGRDLTVWLK